MAEASLSTSAARALRLDHFLLFWGGFALALTEVVFRKNIDLPLCETVLATWGLSELFARRLRLETARAPAFYVLAACCALLAGWITFADSMNAQAIHTTIRNILKYLILLLVVAWICFSPSKDRIAAFLMGTIVASITVGFSVLAANPNAPHLAKYHTPDIGLLLLAAWSAGRPFSGGWRILTSLLALAVALLAVSASARWSMVSAGIVATAAIFPCISRNWIRAAVLVACVVPLVPLLVLDPGTALAVIAERDLRSAADVERVALYAFAHETISRSPWFGVGFEMFLPLFESRFGHILTMTSAVQGPHNQYAAVGSLFGVPALLIYAAAVGSAAVLLLGRRRRYSRLVLASVLMWGFMFLANEIADDARLRLYLIATLLACGEPAARSWLGSLLPRRHRDGTGARVQPA